VANIVIRFRTQGPYYSLRELTTHTYADGASMDTPRTAESRLPGLYDKTTRSPQHVLSRTSFSTLDTGMKYQRGSYYSASVA